MAPTTTTTDKDKGAAALLHVMSFYQLIPVVSVLAYDAYTALPSSNLGFFQPNVLPQVSQGA